MCKGTQRWEMKRKIICLDFAAIVWVPWEGRAVVLLMDHLYPTVWKSISVLMHGLSGILWDVFIMRFNHIVIWYKPFLFHSIWHLRFNGLKRCVALKKVQPILGPFLVTLGINLQKPLKEWATLLSHHFSWFSFNMACNEMASHESQHKIQP